MELRRSAKPARWYGFGLQDLRAAFLRPVEIFACVSGNEAMRSAGKRSAFDRPTLRIMNSQGEWVSMVPMPELEAGAGFSLLCLAVHRPRSGCALRLELPRGQAPGKYLASSRSRLRESKGSDSMSYFAKYGLMIICAAGLASACTGTQAQQVSPTLAEFTKRARGTVEVTNVGNEPRLVSCRPQGFRCR